MEKEIKDVNKCIKIIYKMLLLHNTDNLTFIHLLNLGYEFEVHEINTHIYHVICFHPILKRLDFINDEDYLIFI